MDTQKIAVFKSKKIRKIVYKNEWWFSVVDVYGALTKSTDEGAYWRKLKQRLVEEGSEVVTNCHGLKMIANVSESLFSQLGEASTTELTNSENPDGFIENKSVSYRGGRIAGKAREDLEKQTGRKITSKENYLEFAKKKIK